MGRMDSKKPTGRQNLTNLRMYGSRTMTQRNVCATSVGLMWMSKNSCYESPYVVIGDIKSVGLKENPKSVMHR
ncbi:hypothetical protein BTK_31184 (plasmid) [Bacillus thuringiensis serovar kurstaki str. HD-1]|nr:hypothetical protein BTK_31184 [Bacillus thuringiensis serovar kurstaki str. HD-1]